MLHVLELYRYTCNLCYKNGVLRVPLDLWMEWSSDGCFLLCVSYRNYESHGIKADVNNANFLKIRETQSDKYALAPFAYVI